MKDKIYHQPNLAKSWFLALLCFWLYVCSRVGIATPSSHLSLRIQAVRQRRAMSWDSTCSTRAIWAATRLPSTIWICRVIIVKTSFIIATSTLNAILTRLRNWVMLAMISRYMAPNCGWSSTAPTRWRWQMPILAKSSEDRHSQLSIPCL